MNQLIQKTLNKVKNIIVFYQHRFLFYINEFKYNFFVYPKVRNQTKIAKQNLYKVCNAFVYIISDSSFVPALFFDKNNTQIGYINLIGINEKELTEEELLKLIEWYPDSTTYLTNSPLVKNEKYRFHNLNLLHCLQNMKN